MQYILLSKAMFKTTLNYFVLKWLYNVLGEQYAVKSFTSL